MWINNRCHRCNRAQPMELTVDGRVHRLEAGDSFSFKSQLRHRYANPSDSEDTLVVWAITPIILAPNPSSLRP